jgi:4-diphosphocytidyl-2-C-methyl-D-erythritol kinase
VPFALHGGTAIGTGRGDRIEPLAVAPRSLHWLVARSATGLSTPAVYAVLDGLRAHSVVPDPSIDQRLVTVLERGLVGALGLLVDNDLEAAVLELRPALRPVLAAGREAGARAALVSGSGPTLAFLVDARSAATVARTLVRQPAVAGLHRVTGPAPGAAVVMVG